MLSSLSPLVPLSLSSHTHVVSPPRPPPRSKIDPSRRGSTRRGRTSGGGGGAAAAGAEAFGDVRLAIGNASLSSRRAKESAFGLSPALVVRLCSVSEREETQPRAVSTQEYKESRRAERSTQGAFSKTKEFSSSSTPLPLTKKRKWTQAPSHTRLPPCRPFFPLFSFLSRSAASLHAASCPLRPPSSSSSMPLWPAVRPRTPSRASR